MIVSDNGTELASMTILRWSQDRRVLADWRDGDNHVRPHTCTRL